MNINTNATINIVKPKFFIEEVVKASSDIAGTSGDGDAELHILIDDLPCVKGTVKSNHPEDGRSTNRIVFSLRFKPSHTLANTINVDDTKIIQVDKVSIDREFGNQGLASFAYSRLAMRGFIILSDNSQFTDGKMLWKKMAERAHLRDYKIYILDDEYGFITKDGKPVVYDSKNIDDAKIWTSGDNFDGFHKLLVMKA